MKPLHFCGRPTPFICIFIDWFRNFLYHISVKNFSVVVELITVSDFGNKGLVFNVYYAYTCVGVCVFVYLTAPTNIGNKNICWYIGNKSYEDMSRTLLWNFHNNCSVVLQGVAENSDAF
jgi:hypothetical protein